MSEDKPSGITDGGWGDYWRFSSPPVINPEDQKYRKFLMEKQEDRKKLLVRSLKLVEPQESSAKDNLTRNKFFLFLNNVQVKEINTACILWEYVSNSELIGK